VVVTAATSAIDKIVVEEARAVAAIHVTDPLGFCVGCMDTAARICWSPCPHSVWAATVMRSVAAEVGA
jgi:hypothetical protein